MEKKDFLWDWLKHENSILNTRSSIFVVAEAVLVGYVLNQNHNLSLLIIGLGGILSLLWLLINFKHIYGTHCQIQKEFMKEKDWPYAELVERRNCIPWSNHSLMGIFIPITFLVVWIILFIFTILLSS